METARRHVLDFLLRHEILSDLMTNFALHRAEMFGMFLLKSFNQS